MKRRIILSIALVLSIVLISLTSSDSTAQAQRNRTFTYDSGIVMLEPNQTLIGLLVPAVHDDGEIFWVRSRKMQYSQSSCTGSFCRHVVSSDVTSSPVQLAIGEGASDTVAVTGSPSGARIVFMSNNPNLRGTVQIVDSVTGAVVSSWSLGSQQPTAF